MQFLHNKYRAFLSEHNFSLENDEYTYLSRSIEQSKDFFNRFYINKKIQKTPWKPCLIVSYCGSLLYGLGKWIDKQLQPIVRATAAYAASSFDLCE